ncbi:hypothetical protein NP493_68g02023 [Ridgeia piscesae]|uniref:Dynein heavy chain linker domain-containing protein n=1 Tax=Ridgeia piscesae TaxID=27915 RepID=A0AAD9UIH4_RIDPI|nr:hypothetical protein NP493_68g02023 [Ridgeia piscesae]
MQSSSAAGSFQDEVFKWQKQLQMIEAVMIIWLDVQRQWTELEEIYSTPEVRTVLSHDANMFTSVNRDFGLLMKATEKNPNILQCCQRKNIQAILEKMAATLGHCRKSLLNYLETRRQKYPRFFFLSIDDVLHIICNGYDLSCVNQYISKLYENVGALVHEDIEDSEKKWNTQITAVSSHQGETLLLTDPVPCEGAIDGWLSTLLHQLQVSLKQQVVSALREEDPLLRTSLTSAGANTIESKHSKCMYLPINYGATTSKENDGPPVKDADQSSGDRADDQTDDQADDQADDQTNGNKWLSDHVAEVVYLATQVQLTKQTVDVFSQLQSDHPDAWKKATDKMATTMKTAIALLKGTQEDRINSSRRSKSNGHHGSSVTDGHKAEEDEREVRPGSELAPSRLSSTLDPSNGDHPKLTADDTDHDDLKKTSMETTAEPVDTMNLLEIPIVAKKDEDEDQEEEDKEVDAMSEQQKQLLFPSHIHKISSLIGLFAHQRDLQQRLQASQCTAESFEWTSQLQYHFSTESQSVSIQHPGKSQLQYHFSTESQSVSIQHPGKS